MRVAMASAATPTTAAASANERLPTGEEPIELIQRIADQTLRAVGAAEGVLVGLVEGEAIHYVCGSGRLAGFVGHQMDLDGSLSGAAIRAGKTLVTADSETDDRVNRAKTREFEVRSSVCVPLGQGGAQLGILNVSSSHTSAFDPRDVELLSEVAGFVSAVIASASRCREAAADRASSFVSAVLNPGAEREQATRGQVEYLLSGRAFKIVFQPIFDLTRGGLFAAEALARFDDVPPTEPGGAPVAAGPDVWIDRAHSVGLGVDLELALIEQALQDARGSLRNSMLTLNLGPDALASPHLRDVLADLDHSKIVIELTEHVRVDDYPHLAESLWTLRERGVRLAIDDTGAGFASLMHILKLAPDYIKLDRQLTTGIDSDPVLRALASSLVHFAAETDAVLIAEGVETRGELAALRDLGIRYAQGFHLSRPVAISGLAAAHRRGAEHVLGRPRTQVRKTAGPAGRRPTGARTLAP
jgi:EAL domain-containing protein (putative c-di-GMP-specific phosphodiesterase class I)